MRSTLSSENTCARSTELAISEAALGSQLGLTFGPVQKYEKGSNQIGTGRLYQLAALLNVPVQYFFKGLSESLPEQPGRSLQIAVEDDAELHDPLD